MTDAAPSTVRASLSRPGSGPQPVELLRSENWQLARFRTFPAVEPGGPAENTLRGPMGLHRRCVEAWTEALDTRDRIAADPMLSDYARAKQTETALARLLREVDELAGERLGHAERARRRIEGEREAVVRSSFPEASRRRVQLEAEVRAMVRGMAPHERAAFLRRAIAEGDTLSVAALLTAPNILVDLEPETRAHLEGEWRAKVASAETAALEELQRATEAAGWAATQFRRLVTEHLTPPDPGRPAA